VVLVLLKEWLLFIIRYYSWLCVDRLLFVQWTVCGVGATD